MTELSLIAFCVGCVTVVALTSQWFLYRLGIFRIKRITPEQYERDQ